ncbi:PREDICTED: probable tRNA methyltransferase 9-like protein [Gekko japonicus]|uniref:Probable tRNA methyltransferase 9-like protein n=1 Tax=Gekko japonicus TaxID=146911 RepID=A0ABM1L769_GEKJA|nr:PREDICTED: probable tRNA methyltransferase 9-like protein [Gekko japonicus]
MEQEASQLEKKHVHSVYESTAAYFSDLQSKAWPRVRQFLLEQQPGSLIADIGCGTGKYLGVNSQVYNLGCDYCGPLVEIARNNGCEVMICDNLNLPFRGQCLNAIISVGVIHHFSTKQRRIKAIKEMARLLVPGGQMMIYVWAMEQKTRRFEKQDVFVPWDRALCSQLLSESNKAGLRNDLVRAVKPQTPHAPHLTDSEYLCPLALDQKHPHRTESCLPEACCVKMSDEEENRFYSVLGRSFRAWFSSRSLDESALRKPNGKLEPLKNMAGWRNSTVSIQPSRHCSLDLGCQGALLKGQRLDDYEEVFMKHVACKKMEWLRASRSLRDFNGEPPVLAQNKNGETLFLSDPVENRSNGYIYQGSGRSLSGRHFRRTSSTGSSDSIVDAAVAVEDQTAHGLDTKAFMRYYHVFREGELCSLLEESVPEVHVLSSSYDHGNWCIIVEKTDVPLQV